MISSIIKSIVVYMNLNKNNLPIAISLVASIITLLLISSWEEASLLLVLDIGIITLGLWFLCYVLLLFRQIRKHIEIATINGAFIIYLGAIFTSMSRFKSAIAQADIDLNMVGIGLALIAIGLGFAIQKKEKQFIDQDKATNIKDKSSHQDKSALFSRLSSIIIFGFYSFYLAWFLQSLYI